MVLQTAGLLPLKQKRRSNYSTNHQDKDVAINGTLLFLYSTGEACSETPDESRIFATILFIQQSNVVFPELNYIVLCIVHNTVIYEEVADDRDQDASDRRTKAFTIKDSATLMRRNNTLTDISYGRDGFDGGFGPPPPPLPPHFVRTPGFFQPLPHIAYETSIEILIIKAQREKPTLIIEHREANTHVEGTATLEFQSKGFSKLAAQVKHDTPPKIKKIADVTWNVSETVTIEVEMDGNPTPILNLTNNGKNITEEMNLCNNDNCEVIADVDAGKYRLVFQTITCTDGGVYNLTAVNNEGTNSQDFKLNVHGTNLEAPLNKPKKCVWHAVRRSTALPRACILLRNAKNDEKPMKIYVSAIATPEKFWV
uniref:I-set domain-containing protein n=1 Tax=Glossina austeni TaxID=7395 RepID=A0A1A9V0Z0_GLOAU